MLLRPCPELKCIFLLIGILLLSACSSSFKVLDTWTSAEFSRLENKKILVICKTSDIDYRKQIEKDIVRRLQSQGVRASESNTMLSFLKPPASKEEEQKIKTLIRESGFDGLLLASVKSIIESIKDDTDHSIENGDIPGAASLSKTYVLEANVYDLTGSGGGEVVGVNLVGITDPASVDKLSNSYSKIISKQFKKGM